MEEPEFRDKLSEWMWKVEGLFAEAKQNHGLARAREPAARFPPGTSGNSEIAA